MDKNFKNFLDEHYNLVLDKYYVPQTIFVKTADGIVPLEGDIPDDLYMHMAMYINGIDIDPNGLSDIDGFPNYIDGEGQA